MFSHSFYYHRPDSVRTHYTLLSYLTPRALAIAMFIGFALLGIVGGKESQAKKPSFGKTGDPASEHRDPSACGRATKDAKPKRFSLETSWQAISAMMNGIHAAFNNPELIDYANQQGTGMPETTASFGTGTAGQFAHSRSISNSPTTQQ